MRSATLWQPNISAVAKNGLGRLDNSLDIITSIRSVMSQRSAFKSEWRPRLHKSFPILPYNPATFSKSGGLEAHRKLGRRRKKRKRKNDAKHQRPEQRTVVRRLKRKKPQGTETNADPTHSLPRTVSRYRLRRGSQRASIAWKPLL